MNAWVDVVVLAIGGALGTLARYSISRWSNEIIQSWSVSILGAPFPIGTVVVNLGGTFVIAVVATIAGIISVPMPSSIHAPHSIITPTMRLFLITGFCGGFTTFSSLMLDCVQMLESRSYAALGLYGVLSTIGAAFCFFAGWWCARFIIGRAW